VYREWEGKRTDSSMLKEGLTILSLLKQEQVDAVIDSLREQKKGRMLVRALCVQCTIHIVEVTTLIVKAATYIAE
jgi:hypothetical protein